MKRLQVDISSASDRQVQRNSHDTIASVPHPVSGYASNKLALELNGVSAALQNEHEAWSKIVRFGFVQLQKGNQVSLQTLGMGSCDTTFVSSCSPSLRSRVRTLAQPTPTQKP